jgi:hypothetical protein
MLRTTNAAGRIRDESLMNLGGRDVYVVVSNDIRAVSVIFNMLNQIVHRNSLTVFRVPISKS